tara:strand:+ start:86 stop:502 length:417 start_codon:yes stop_codon:yes gene_type:complete
LSDDISDKDKKDWENFLKSEKKIVDKDFNIQRRHKFKKKLIDLHGYTLDEANILVEKFILDCFENNISQLIIITGKGLHSENERNPFVSKELSILKNSVPEYIKSNVNLMKLIKEIREAEIEDGGSGAFYVFLKKNFN